MLNTSQSTNIIEQFDIEWKVFFVKDRISSELNSFQWIKSVNTDELVQTLAPLLQMRC